MLKISVKILKTVKFLCYLCKVTIHALRVRLHVTEAKPHPRIKLVPRRKNFCLHVKFHPGMKRVEVHPGMKFHLKENLPLSMKTYNKVYYAFSIIEIRSLTY